MATREGLRTISTGGESSSSFWSSHDTNSRISNGSSTGIPEEEEEGMGRGSSTCATLTSTPTTTATSANAPRPSDPDSFSRRRRHRLTMASQISIRPNNIDTHCFSSSATDEPADVDDLVLNLEDPMRPLQSFSNAILHQPPSTAITTSPSDYDPQQQKDEFEPWIRTILSPPSCTAVTSIRPTTNIDWALSPGLYQTTLCRRTKLTTNKSSASNMFFSPLSRGASTSAVLSTSSLSTTKRIITSNATTTNNNSNTNTSNYYNYYVPRSTSSPDLRHYKSPNRRNIFPSSAIPTASTLNMTDNDSTTTKGLNYLHVGIRESPIEEEEEDSEEGEDIHNNIHNIICPSLNTGRTLMIPELEEQEAEVDMSLGMKLTIIGGNVIVQDLVPLKDGRASPAQLSGKISVGDVLLAVDNKSLQGLDISALVTALQPLKGPTKQQQQQQPVDHQQQQLEDDTMTITSSWTRQTQHTALSQRSNSTVNKTMMKMQVTLLFAIGEGLPLLLREKEQQRLQQQQQQQQPDDLMISPFTTHFGGVDSFSGMPFLLPFGGGAATTTSTGSSDETTAVTLQPSTSLPNIQSTTESTKKYDVQQQITVLEASPLVPLKNIKGHLSKAAAVTTAVDTIVAPPTDTSSRHPTAPKTIIGGKFPTPQQQRLQNIALHISVARELSFMEWYSNYFDLLEDMPPLLRYDYGAASAQRKMLEEQRAEILSKEEKIKNGRRVIQEAVAILDRVEELDRTRDDTSEYPSTTSTIPRKGTADKNDESIDEEFLQWKSNIASLLGKAKREAMVNIGQSLSPTSATITDNVIAASNQEAAPNSDVTIEGLLFGKQVFRILNRKKSNALPDSSLSSALYSIIKQLEEVDVASDTLLAGTEQKIEFLLSSVLPRWMKTFKPLKWQYRRILWPVQTTPAVLGHGTSDELSSIASSSLSGSVNTSASIFSNFQQKNLTNANPNANGVSPMTLENIVEELELNPETRVHACSLVTFYFTRAVCTMTQEKAIKFVRTFGAYLNLSRSLAVTSRLRYGKVIDLLLDMAAKYDVIHKNAKLDFDKVNTGLAMGDQPPLSVLFQYLKERTLENSAVLPFLVSGYPDLQPWMVRMSAYSGALGSLESQKNYYEYLSTLLDPMYGYENARSDSELVREWCILSVSSEAPDYRSNFYSVAKETGKVFNRDLPLLLHLSMKISDYELSLALGFHPTFDISGYQVAELLSDPMYRVDATIVNNALNNMRQISKFALASDIVDSNLLSQVFKCYNLLLGKYGEPAMTNFTELSDELGFAIALCKEDARKLDAVVEVAVNIFPPAKALETIQLSNPRRSKLLLHSLRVILTRSAMDEYQAGVSGSLLRVRRAHQALKKKPMPTTTSNASDEIARLHLDSTIWCDVLEGVAVIEK